MEKSKEKKSHEVPNVDIRPRWTQSDELAADIQYLQESRGAVKRAMEKWALDTDEKKRAHRLLTELHSHTCEVIAKIDSLREKTKPVRCEHRHMISRKCQDCGKAVYVEPLTE